MSSEAKIIAAHVEDIITARNLDDSDLGIVVIARHFATAVINAENPESAIRSLATHAEYPLIIGELLKIDDALREDRFLWSMVRRYLLALEQVLDSTQVTA